MAKILFSGIAGVDMRNKLNGSVFSKNRYGGYVRTKVTPVNPQTTAQQAARNNLSTWSQAWRGLTESQRQGWIDGAVSYPFTDIYGNAKILSGQALFVKLNTNLYNYGTANIEDCPSPTAIPALNSITLTGAAGTPALSLAFNPSPVDTDFTFVVFATPQVTPGKSFVKNLFRWLPISGGVSTTPANILSSYVARFGPLVEGQKVFVRCFLVSKTTGQAGIPLQAMAIIAA